MTYKCICIEHHPSINMRSINLLCSDLPWQAELREAARNDNSALEIGAQLLDTEFFCLIFYFGFKALNQCSKTIQSVTRTNEGNHIVYLFTLVFCLQMINWNEQKRHLDTLLCQRLLS